MTNRFFFLLILSVLCFRGGTNANMDNSDIGVCQKVDDCGTQNNRYLFYDVNPPEGFNLRRDVYLRMAIFVSELRKQEKYSNWFLVLPPWFSLYHWRVAGEQSYEPMPWSYFFDIESLQSYIPVVEMYDAVHALKGKKPLIDRIYALKHFKNAFEGGKFVEKWNVMEKCGYDPTFWGYRNVTYRHIECVEFQGGASKFGELLKMHQNDETVMFANAEVALHEHYIDKIFWTARKSMKFSNSLIEIAHNYILGNFACHKSKCGNYFSVHWRRRDFASSRSKEVPSTMSSAKQISNISKKLNISDVFIATDAPSQIFKELRSLLQEHSVDVYKFEAGESLLQGQIAIVDQIICSRSAYFVGTHESTFTFRIQEEREILGFESDLTFNVLCPDSGPCQKPSRWKIVN